MPNPHTFTGDPYQNLASVRNQGVELVLNSVNVRSKAFTWTTDFNISFNKSKVVSLYGDGSGSNSFIQNYDSRVDFLVEVGKPLGQFYGYKYAGVYTTDDFTQNADGTYTLNAGVPYLKGKTKSSIKPGDVKYVTTAGETDKDGNPIWSTNDRAVIGNAAPDFTGGLNNTFKYKNFDLSVFCTFSVGNDIFNMSSQRFIGPYLPNQNTLNVMKDRYHLIDPATGKESTNLARLAELNPSSIMPAPCGACTQRTRLLSPMPLTTTLRMALICVSAPSPWAIPSPSFSSARLACRVPVSTAHLKI